MKEKEKNEETEAEMVSITMLQQRHGKQELIVMLIPNPKKRKRDRRM